MTTLTLKERFNIIKDGITGKHNFRFKEKIEIYDIIIEIENYNNFKIVSGDKISIKIYDKKKNNDIICNWDLEFDLRILEDFHEFIQSKNNTSFSTILDSNTLLTINKIINKDIKFSIEVSRIMKDFIVSYDDISDIDIYLIFIKLKYTQTSNLFYKTRLVTYCRYLRIKNKIINLFKL